jgi:hypothetical protein
VTFNFADYLDWAPDILGLEENMQKISKTYQAGTTRIGDNELSQQDLLEIIINSYKLSMHKIKNPNKLRIICKRTEGFSINSIETT